LDLSHIRKPPVPVDKIARGLGIRLVFERLRDVDVSGFYYRKGNQRLIGVNSIHPAARQRFTIAHELGHAVLTSHDNLHVDRSFLLRDANSGRGVDRLEIEANAFAAELLMPAEPLQERLRAGLDLDDPGALRRLAEEFGVSMQALMIRLANLPFIIVGDNPWVATAPF
jgi:Zn-dependent peptidase ImmA (M78 family)